jgi:hypothetical protein
MGSVRGVPVSRSYSDLAALVLVIGVIAGTAAAIASIG